MPYEDETAMMGDLAAMPEPTAQGQAPPAAPPMQPGQALGGQGVDTPQEQQAVELLMQAAMMMRQAAETDPGLRPYIDKHLQGAFLDISTYYGFGEDAKLALKQATMQRDRERSGMMMKAGASPMGMAPRAAQIKY